MSFSFLKGKVVIVGIGNVLRGDDGFGPFLIQALEGKTKAVLIDAGNAPENYTGKISREKPDTILLVDALHLGLAPGTPAVLKKDEILKSGFTTHDISPNLFIEFLENETGAEIALLGVQPEGLSVGAELSGPVQRTLETLAEQIKEHLHA